MITKLRMQHPKCTCVAKLLPYIIYTKGVTLEQIGLLILGPSLHIHIIEFTSTHDRYINQAIKTKIVKYNPLLDQLKHNDENLTP